MRRPLAPLHRVAIGVVLPDAGRLLAVGEIAKILDGNWVDIATFVVAVLYAAFMCRKEQVPVVSKQAGLRVAHGVALFPLLLLALSSLSTPALEAPRALPQDNLVGRRSRRAPCHSRGWAAGLTVAGNRAPPLTYCLPGAGLTCSRFS
jgi:hypothetical protein